MARKILVNSKPKRQKILIVCEGERTEPYYFEAIRAKISKHDVFIHGTGKNTLTLVEETNHIKEQHKRELQREYDQVWAVFDRDSFPSQNFDNAIYKCRSKKIDAAWSNEAFELWYVFHFTVRITAMSRNEYKKWLERKISELMGKTFIYEKNRPDMYDILQKYGDEAQAIIRAKNQENNFLDDGISPARQNPCTLVYKLVEALNILEG